MFCFIASAQSLSEIKSTPHFSECFTQGLIIKDNKVWESCGGYGKSQIIHWNLNTKKVIRQISIDDKYFAEGLTELNGRLFMLTWKAGMAFEYDIDSFKIIKKHRYKGQGWGLTTNGTQLIMSNGTDTLQFINPETFKVETTIRIHLADTSIFGLNELEWIDGKIWANIYQTDYIVVIEPTTGLIVEKYSLPNLLESDKKKPGVLNGIAYDKAQQKTWVTGKNWPLLFEL